MVHAVGIPKMQPATLLADLTKHIMGSFGWIIQSTLKNLYNPLQVIDGYE
jgi:hypothetical protein